MAVKRKTIFISGASSGLGAGMARVFAARGHDLALSARRIGPLEALREELLVHGGRVEVRTLDVTDRGLVFDAMREFDRVLGGLDRVIVNAGSGDGRRIGIGQAARNFDLATTNFLGALAQTEAALELFRTRNSGHLVLVSSISAVRGLPGAMAVYAASKAAVAHLGEGLSLEFARTPVRITTILPGFIRTPINAHASRLPFAVDEMTGVRALVKAIEAEPKRAYVPSWPWSPLAGVLRIAPFELLRRMAG